MRKKKAAINPLLLGIFVSQVLSTFHVYLSNRRLHQALDALQAAGYVTVPNQIVAPLLNHLTIAFNGGLFFTLTTGACLTLLSIASAWIWNILCQRRKGYLIPIAIVWAGSLALANMHGFCLEAFTQFLLIPPTVFIASWRWFPDARNFRISLKHTAALLPLCVIVLSAAFFVDTGIFINIRDKLFLSNPLGEKINDFYYRYTMPPAELFKSPAQKLLKTCHIVLPEDPASARRIQGMLARYDYLRVDREIPVDLTVEKSGEQLVLSNAGRRLIVVDPAKMLTDTGNLLAEFSKKADRYVFLRQFTLISLFLVVPLVFYAILYVPTRFLTGRFMGSDRSALLSSGLCAFFLVLAIVVFKPDSPGFSNTSELNAALGAENRWRRISGLKHVCENRIDIANFSKYRKLLISPDPVERYWLARALGMSRHPKTLKDLLLFLEDPHPNVQCMALFSIGLRKNRSVISRVMAKLKTSDHWYVQWYAYRALRELGWKQTIKFR